MKILLTGGNGFVGAHLAERIINSEGLDLVMALRQVSQISKFPSSIYIPNIDGETNWSAALLSINVVVHAAARAHISTVSTEDSVCEYQRINVDGTLNLARQAAQSGITRFIYISSIGVNGISNIVPFTELDTPNPVTAYAQSKYDAELGLWEISRETGMEIVIIRPPLVYGPNAPGNFGSLIHFIKKGMPLPFGAIHNLRSYVAVDNLVDLIITCIDHPAAANQVFLVCDGKDLSTTQLLLGIYSAMGRSSRLLPVPQSLIMLCLSLLGKRSEAQSLLGSLRIDMSKARKLLGWAPPITVETALRSCFEYKDK